MRSSSGWGDVKVERRSIIETQELTKKYDTQIAVDHLTLQIEEGEVFGFLGPNGAGKTTTLLMFLGLTEPTSGKVRVCGFDPAPRGPALHPAAAPPPRNLAVGSRIEDSKPYLARSFSRVSTAIWSPQLTPRAF